MHSLFAVHVKGLAKLAVLAALVIGGGTYARAFDNVVAFGARFPGEPELGHMKNEKISADNMVRLAQIYAEAVYELAKAED